MVQTTVWQVAIGALIMTALITGTFTMIAMSVPEDSGNFTDYNRSYNKFNQIKSDMEEIANATEGAQPAEGQEGILTGLYQSSFGALTSIWDSLVTLKAIIGDMSSGGFPISLPGWFTGLLISIITITVALAMIASWRKWYT